VKVVLANGCFDLFHYGHLIHLKAAKAFGERLIVSVTRDQSVNKGPGRPVFSEDQRVEILRSLNFVDGVILVDSSIEALKYVRPQFFAKGNEYKERIQPEDASFCFTNNVSIVFTNTKKWSSTELLNHESRHR
jgi:rfaE bifunctional protein nucleotidyltransferase chain/domain